MIISRKRIRSIEKYLGFLGESEKIYVSTECPQDLFHEENVQFILQPCGPITRFNRDGKMVTHKDQQKTSRIIERDYHIKDWHGNYHDGICFESRMCYPREYISPPMETVVIENNSVRSSVVTKGESERLLHIINMFLERFGTCEIIDADKNPVLNSNLKVLQWEILPPGKYPWEKAKDYLEKHFNGHGSKDSQRILKHHKAITKHEPEFMAIGKDGFSGYVVYGYPNNDLFIFESNQLDNATYIFNRNWEELSKMTKRDLILNNLYLYRYIHNPDWEEKIDLLMK